MASWNGNSSHSRVLTAECGLHRPKSMTGHTLGQLLVSSDSQHSHKMLQTDFQLIQLGSSKLGAAVQKVGPSLHSPGARYLAHGVHVNLHGVHMNS